MPPPKIQRTVAPLLFALVATFAALSATRADTVLARGDTLEVEARKPGSPDLWVTPSDLERISGFVLKDQGACLDEVCVPTDDALLESQPEGIAFNASELARRIDQALVADPATRVFSFGPVPATRTSFLRDARAPDFELPDRDGRSVRLSDFRGKKVLLISWASW